MLTTWQLNPMVVIVTEQFFALRSEDGVKALVHVMLQRVNKRPIYTKMLRRQSK